MTKTQVKVITSVQERWRWSRVEKGNCFYTGRLLSSAMFLNRSLSSFLGQRRSQRLALGRTGGVLQRAVHALRLVTPALAANRQHTFADRRRNGGRRQAVACQMHDPRPPDDLLRRVAVADRPIQPLAIHRADQNPLFFLIGADSQVGGF